MSETLTQYDVETELEIYDAALDTGIIDDETWAELIARFLHTFRDC